ncbi:hypothetical protein TTRE_0000834301 [Trichuris trichiura]|uniref:Uncharacterized protein n=1 Tax=Trichuris trichiura TaxID=36087 RepID=A0A077ZI06_TRITR|nr:hypothetical protein TTRE_0000834301 [Trichuris trichiura]
MGRLFRRVHCYSDTATGLDSGFDSTRNSADYQSTTASSLSSEDRWYQSLMLQSTARAKNLSSSSSGGSSDLSSEAAVHQGKVDTTLLHPQVGVGNLVIGSRNLPLNISVIGSDKGAPAMETISLADTNSARPFNPCSGAKYWSSRFADVPSTSTDLTKCSSLVDLATRAIEGVTQMAVSQQGSPELTSYNLVLQASRRKIVLLEERVKHLLTELSGERESKRHLEAEVSHLNDENKALSNELKAAKEELQHFTQWFHSTVENPMAYLQEPVLNDHQ